MGTFVLFLILGLGSGAVYAALGLGLVVTYRSSGVVNLATGAIALYVAYTYAFLRQGELGGPTPGLHSPPGVGAGPPRLRARPAGLLARLRSLAGDRGRARRAALRTDLPPAAGGARSGQGRGLG